MIASIKEALELLEFYIGTSDRLSSDGHMEVLGEAMRELEELEYY